MKTHQLYPVEIFEFRFDPDGVDYIDIINSSNLERRPHTWVENTELDLHHLEEWEPVVDFFHTCLGEIHSHFNYDCKGFRVTSMWANKYEEGVAQEPHRHANSFYSGNLFLNEGSPLMFFDPIQQRAFGQMEIFRRPKITLSGIEQNAPIMEKVEAMPHKLVIFPSWFVHSTQQAYADRDSVSFNSMPVGQINQGILNMEVL